MGQKKEITLEETTVSPEAEEEPRIRGVFSGHAISLEVTNLADLQIVAAMPGDLQDRAMTMAENEQNKRHEIVERENKRAHERYLDANQKNYDLGLRRLEAICRIDIVAKIASCVVIFFYLVILAISIIINRMEAFYTLSAVGGAMAIIIGYITNNKKN